MIYAGLINVSMISHTKQANKTFYFRLLIVSKGKLQYEIKLLFFFKN